MPDDLFSSLFPDSVIPDLQEEACNGSSVEPRGRVIWSVSSLLASVQDRLEFHFDLLWVEGEVSNLRSPGSGHLYFTLKDDSSQIRAVMFKSQAGRLPFALEDGQHLLCLGRVNIYRNRGDLQLVVDAAEPAGEGALRLAFEQLKERLAREGLFEKSSKKELPAFPSRIFLITSPTGAALHDFVKTARMRYKGVEIIICPVKVQGDEAADEIIKGLALAEHAAGLGDVIVIARGGGSLEDLWPFNDESLARAIFACKIPVVSAIGHEVDFTIADFVADARAATPTAAAQLVVPDVSAYEERVRLLESRLADVLRQNIREKSQRVHFLEARLKEPRWILAEHRLMVDEFQNRLAQLVEGKRAHFLNQLASLGIRLASCDPLKYLSGLGARLELLEQSLHTSVERIVESKQTRLSGLAGRLHSLSPLGVLSRGYSLVYSAKTGRIVTNAKDVGIGDKLKVRLARGCLECKVESVRKGEE